MGMKFSAKSASIGFIVGALFFSGVSYAAGGGAYKIVQNGIDKTPIAEDLKPLVQNGRVYVPVRTIANLLDVSIGYDNATKTVTLGEKIVGSRVKSLSSYGGGVDSVTYPNEFTINKNSYKAPGILIYSDSTYNNKGKLTLNLDGKYKKFNFSLGVEDKSDRAASMNLKFTDEAGRVIEQYQTGYGGIAEDLNVDVTNCLQLVIEVDINNFKDTYVALINPILQ